MYELIALGIVGVIAAINTIVNYLILKGNSEEKNRLVKALIAQNAIEYAQTEMSPKEELKKMKIENDLAMKAAEIEKERNKEVRIPIT